MTPRELGKIHLGKGVNIFDPTLSPHPDKEYVVNVKAMGDDEIVADPVAHTGIYEATGDSFAEFTRKFAADVGLKGSRLGFSAAVKAAYSSAVTRSATTKYTRINNTIVGHSVTIGRDPDVFVRGWLTDRFKDALTRQQPAEEMFREYGTHVAMTVMIGGSACYRCYSAATKSLTDQTFTLSARAKFKSKGGSIGGSTTLTAEEIQLLTNVEGEMSLDVYGGGYAEAQDLRDTKPDAWKKWAESVEEAPAFLSFAPEGGLLPIWEFVADPTKRQELETAYKKMVAKHFPVEIFSTTSGSSNRPEASVVIPDDYKLLSGGAFIDEIENGSLFLTASFPESNNRWRAMGKAHIVDQSAPLTVYAMALHDPDNIWEVRIFEDTSAPPAAHPSGSAFMGAEDYHLVGGGARVDYGTGEGNLLTASYPTGRYWRSDSKDHSAKGTPSPATITTYAIGLRSWLPGVVLVTGRTESRSQRQAHPSAHASPASGYTMVGGGAQVQYTGGGNLLAASYPLDSNTWKASSKDLIATDPATIDAFALGLTVLPMP